MANRYLLTLIFCCFFTMGFAPGLFNHSFGKSADLAFVENKGQVTDQFGTSRNDIDFKIQAANGLNIFIGKGQMHYQWVKPVPAAHAATVAGEESSTSSAPIDMYRMDVELLGTNPQVRITTENATACYERYYLSSVGNNGAVARSFRKVIYHDVYPFIDWQFYFNQEGKLEHDFIVRPGGKVSDIRLAYKGATELNINAGGRLTAVTPYGVIIENAPYVFEKASKRKVKSGFILQQNILSFKIDQNYKGTLVIDPSIEWSSYFGGVEYDETRTIKPGRDGYLYIAGSTNSTTNIATIGSYQTTFSGGSWVYGSDAFLSKFNADGTCIWTTYYGGAGEDIGSGIAIDTAGSLYIAGRTNSATGIASTGSYQTTKAGSASSNDAYLVKFDTSGQRLWGTYYGGTGHEGNQGMAVASDNFGHIYLTGNTQSLAGIATAGAFQFARPGGHDAFLAKFSTSGSLIWGTYYGGSATDVGRFVCTDSLGNIYLAGNTFSTSLMATAATYQTLQAGNNDAFIAKFDASGQRTWGTYFGGELDDQATGIALDSLLNIYVSGFTTSTTGIASTGAMQTVYGGGQGDGFIAKFNNLGQTGWSTYYGGLYNDACNGILIGSDGNVYVAGGTYSSSGIATANGLNVTLNGLSDALVAGFSSTGTQLWGSYFGGTDLDEAFSVTENTNGILYIAGATSSTLQLATPGSHQSTFGGNYDGMLIKINTCDLPSAPAALTGEISVCEGSSNTYHVSPVSSADSYVWILPSGWSGSSNVDSIVATVNNQSGAIRVAATNECGTGDTIELNIAVNPLPSPQINRNGNILNTTQAFSSYQWKRNGQPIATATNATYLVTENGDYTVTVTGANGCSGTSDTLSIGDITSIENVFKQLGIEVYPNPFLGSFHVNLTIDANIQVYTLAGQLVHERSCKKDDVIIDAQHFAGGTYLLKISGTDGRCLGAQMLVKTSK